MSSPTFLIYGAYGYTGDLIAREAVRRGLRPILAGRRDDELLPLAEELELERRAFGLDDPQTLRAGLEGVGAVLHCAGPFVHTSRPMVDACLAAGVHYLDITGEIVVFESILGRRQEAEEAGVALLPGVGFDVVPSDCLATRLAQALPEAEELRMAFYNAGGTMSRGTMKTMIEGLPGAGAIRRDGRIVPVPVAYDVRKIEFSCGPRWAMTIPWGDVSTAYHSTGIPNIRFYAATPPKMIKTMKRMALLNPILGWGPIKRFLLSRVDRRSPGPDRQARSKARVHLWGEARRGDRVATTTLDVPEGYTLTATTAVEATLRVLAGEVSAGAWTPSKAFGAGFIEEFDGVTLDDTPGCIAPGVPDKAAERDPPVHRSERNGEAGKGRTTIS